ncbi:hypothetical protein [Cellulophaga sp. E6(2014)]|uniref:AbiU2 domain-containing protein n=1 Tax=Cellulophaga sp. E6(2014) TaxID=1495334 RepID=UPI00051DCB86|nr:hypothetical protein [Cellulophaga sp. E6(2014)]KGK29583.1 hypothetical protein EL45_13380 [Cellulophaga sp. E6(2014)]
MNKKEQLKKDLDKITKSIVTFLQSFEFCYYLNYPKSDNILDEKHLKYITNSGFFSFSRYALWRLTIIELHKLTNDNKETDKYNLHHLLRKLEKGGIYQSLNIDESKISEWKTELKKQNESIEQVSSLRFKLYAHTDHNYKNVINNAELTLKETEELINVVVKIIFEIYSIVFDTHFEFKPIHEKKTLRRIVDDILTKRESDRKSAVEKFIQNANKAP